MINTENHTKPLQLYIGDEEPSGEPRPTVFDDIPFLDFRLSSESPTGLTKRVESNEGPLKCEDQSPSNS